MDDIPASISASKAPERERIFSVARQAGAADARETFGKSDGSAPSIHARSWIAASEAVGRRRYFWTRLYVLAPVVAFLPVTIFLAASMPRYQSNGPIQVVTAGLMVYLLAVATPLYVKFVYRPHRELVNGAAREWRHAFTVTTTNLEEELLRIEFEERISRPSPAPEPQPFGVSARGAELLVCEWMRHLGAVDAEVTQYSGDGGIDVASADWIAQVKHYEGTVGVREIREFAGVAAVDGRTALFFTANGYASGASEFADRALIALFVYSAEKATLVPMNDAAHYLTRVNLDSERHDSNP